VWDTTSGLVVNDNNAVAMTSGAEAGAMVSDYEYDTNVTRIVTTILVSIPETI